MRVKVPSLETCFPGRNRGACLEAPRLGRTLKGALWYLKDGVMTVGRCLCIKRKQSETALNMSAPVCLSPQREMCVDPAQLQAW